MKIFLTIFIGITFILFMLSTALFHTEWLDNYFLIYKEQLEFRYIIGYIKFCTSLILIFFLIAQANYMLKLNRNIERKELQLNFGIFFGILLITKMLAFYYMSIPLLELNNKSRYYGGTEAKKDIIHAYGTYMDYGVITEYYDENNTKHKYKPSLKEIQLKEEYKTIEKDKRVFVKLFHEVPLNIVIAFLTMISAFYFSSILAKWKLKKI